MSFSLRDRYQALAALLIVTGVLGLLASGILTIEILTVAQDPGYVPPCNISPFISCTSAMSTPQAALFGFPNSLLGVVGFSSILTVGAMLAAGARVKSWFWQGLQAGVTLAVIAVYWFFYQSVFVIHSLCPFCLVFWAVTIPLFWYVTLYNVREENITLPKRIKAALETNPHLPLVVLYGVILLTIALYFRSYWLMLLS